MKSGEDEDDDDVEPIRKRRKGVEGNVEADTSDEENDGYSDEVVETPRKRWEEKPKGLQTQVFPGIDETLCTQVCGKAP